MKGNKLRTLWLIASLLVANTVFAGGRYEDPPLNLVEVHKFSQQALEAIKQGDKDTALSAAKQGRKLAVESYKEKSTMPMQVSSGSLKEAIAALEANNMADASGKVEHALQKLGEEIDYYKKEGKIK
jgi:DNA-binding FadR family transcriptional regulator